ncbi:MAG: tol-pal system-associated acyl-CoA thioesterase [Paracoccaceae bacterium]
MSHHFTCRVYYEDTDLAGIVYYANYLRFIERARTEYVRTLGIDQGALKSERGLVFAVRRVEADYIAPAHFDDVLDITTTLAAISGAQITLDQQISRGQMLLFSARVTLVTLGAKGRPARLPAELRQALG